MTRAVWLLLLVAVVVAAVPTTHGCLVGDDGSLSCRVEHTLSTEYARRTSLVHVCSQCSPLACLTLLLIDTPLARRFGLEISPVAIDDAMRAEAEAASHVKDHADLGFLRRVDKQEFVRLYAFAAARSLPCQEGRVIFPVAVDPMAAVRFHGPSDTFFVSTKSN